MQEVCLLSVDRALADRLAEALGGSVPVKLSQVVAAPNEAASVIVMDEASAPPDRSLATAVSAVVESARGRPVVLATEKADTETVLQAVRAGAADVIDRHARGSDIAHVLIRLLNAQVASQNSAGHLTLVLGADPESAAIFATDLALARAQGVQGAGHLLVDCTMPTSAAEAYLDTGVEYGIASAVADLHRLDSILLGNALARHESSGLMLLTLDGGTGVEPTGLAAFDIAALLKFLRATCEEVTFCVGSLRNSGLIRSLAAGADGIEFVCAQSIRELKAGRRLIEQLDLDASVLQKTRLVVWGHDDAILLDGRRIMEALGLGSFVNLPVDQAELRNAVNSGRPLGLKDRDTPYNRALRRVGGQRVPPRPPVTTVLGQMRSGLSRLVEWRS
jgi:pilus assembly protein CpaE